MKKTSVTKHGRRRMRERCGLTKGISGVIAHRALHHGIRKEETQGELLFWLNERNLSGHRELRIYGGMLYIFSIDIVITSICLPEAFSRHLEEYVVTDAYKRYVTFKESLRRTKLNDNAKTQSGNLSRTLSKTTQSTLRDPATIRAVLNRSLRDENLKGMVTKVKKSYLYPYHYECRVDCEVTYEIGKICRHLRRIMNPYNLQLRIIARCVNTD